MDFFFFFFFYTFQSFVIFVPSNSEFQCHVDAFFPVRLWKIVSLWTDIDHELRPTESVLCRRRAVLHFERRGMSFVIAVVGIVVKIGVIVITVSGSIAIIVNAVIIPVF